MTTEQQHGTGSSAGPGSRQATTAAGLGERRLPRRRAPGSCSSRSTCAKPPTCTPVGTCWTSRPGAATRRSRLPGSAATRSASTTCPSLLERGRERATAEGLDVALVEGDAEALPFPDSSFDAVDVGVRGDVRAGPRAGRLGAAARLQARRHDRARELDAERVHRRAVPHGRGPCAAAGRRPLPDAVGHRRSTS